MANTSDADRPERFLLTLKKGYIKKIKKLGERYGLKKRPQILEYVVDKAYRDIDVSLDLLKMDNRIKEIDKEKEMIIEEKIKLQAIAADIISKQDAEQIRIGEAIKVLKSNLVSMKERGTSKSDLFKSANKIAEALDIPLSLVPGVLNSL